MSKQPCCPSPAPESTESCCPTDAQAPDACCAPAQQSTCCPPAEVLPQRPGYTLCPYVCGVIKTAAGNIPQVTSRLTKRDHLGHWAMRWGIGRELYRVTPGLYALGTPGPEDAVVVTCNYKMTFDIVRRDLVGNDFWILVLDTKGINVWCAAGKGTFGTDELIQRITAAQLDKIVNHRQLILPQFGAVGVAAQQVRKQSGFKVTYGPVRIIDLPAFLAANNQATEGMRSATFTLRERMVLTPVEFTILWKEVAWALPVLLVLGGIGEDWFSIQDAFLRGGSAWFTGLLGVFCGAVLTPILLPWLPGRAFSLKGAATGVAVSIAAMLWRSSSWEQMTTWAAILFVTAISSYCAMNFTGSTPFTSPSGVEKEMRRAIPLQLAALLGAAVLWVWAAF